MSLDHSPNPTHHCYFQNQLLLFIIYSFDLSYPHHNLIIRLIQYFNCSFYYRDRQKKIYLKKKPIQLFIIRIK